MGIAGEETGPGMGRTVPVRMANFELRHFRSFVAVAEALNFNRAAAAMNIAQPALSRQIAALEEALEVRLFERHPRGIRLTVPGELFLEEVRSVLVKVERAVSRVRLAGDGASGRVAVGLTSAALRHPAVRAALGNLRRDFPGLHLHADAMVSLQQEQELAMGRLDAGFLCEHHLPAEFSSAIIDRDPLHLVLPASHPLAGADAVSLAMLKGESFVWIDATSQSLQNARLLIACADGGLRPRIVQHSNSEQILVGMVQSGLGLAFLPRSLPMPPDLVSRPVADLNLTIDLQFVWRNASPSPALRQLVSCVREAIAAALPAEEPRG